MAYCTQYLERLALSLSSLTEGEWWINECKGQSFNGRGASRCRPCQTCKISGLLALAQFACYTFLELVLNLQNSRPIVLGILLS